MRYPMINKQPRREVSVPTLSGGLNLRDGLSGVRDNQLTDCINMWYKDGMLRTRPPFITNENMIESVALMNDDICIVDVKSHPQVTNNGAVLVSCIVCDGSYESGGWLSVIKFFWQYSDKIVSAGSVDFEGFREQSCKTREELVAQAGKSTRMVFEKDGYVYLFLNEQNSIYNTYKAALDDELIWKNVQNDEYYAPTVYIHCKRSGWDDFEGTLFEGYNMVGNSYKMIYSAYNELDSDDSHPMRYKLAQDLPERGGEIQVEITTCIKGEDETNEKETKVIKTKHKIKYTQEDYEERISQGKIVIETFGEGKTSEDGLRLFVKYNYVGFVIASPDDGNDDKVFVVATLETDDKRLRFACNEDNVVITAPLKVSEEDFKKVMCMTQSIWFGGTAKGINGGSRLFLCGNTNDEEKGLIVWSGLNEPLYFPENNYAYVGDKSQNATAFGKQGENLIIFKEKSVFYSYYASNGEITADELINQTVIDYEANAVCFPIIQLNASIGCDCPNTIELCRNRLVWVNSDGSVYTLYSNNQYSERTIYKVSDMICSVLGKENDLKNAVSCDFEGHYLLAVGNKIYVMDYNSYGYQYASSFSKNEDISAQIPWYIWSCDCGDNGKIYKANNQMMMAKGFKTKDGIGISFSVLSNDEKVYDDVTASYDNELGQIIMTSKKIASKLQTKLYDFSSPGYFKNIDRVSVAFGNNGGKPINIKFVTNAGCQSETITLLNNDINDRDFSFISVRNFYPCTRAVRTFGVKIECNGPLMINGLSLQYRLLGGVK